MSARKFRPELEQFEERAVMSCAGNLGGGHSQVVLQEVQQAGLVVHQLVLPNGNVQAVPAAAVQGLCRAVTGGP